MTASPPLNGHKRPTMPVLGDWRPATPEPQPVEEQRTPQTEPAIEPKIDLVAAAEAAAIRARAEAETEAIRLAAEADAEAKRIKAVEDARKQKLANDKAEARAQEEQAARDARIADSNKKRREAELAQAALDKQAAQAEQDEAQLAEEIAEADNKWRAYARTFYVVCAIVALPVQIAAFYNPRALWLMAAPLMLEGGAWVVLKGAAAAVASHRPHWHYRLIAWLLAAIAAGINLWHGLNAFDPATAIGTAFASIAGPGVWDLHEHGRIRKRNGVPTRRERKTAEKAAKAEAKQRAAEEEQKRAEEKAARAAAEERRQQLAADRQREFGDVWAEAVKIAAAVGSTTDDNSVWVRAYRNIKGCEPGESIESITARRKAEARVEAALTGGSVNTLSKTTNAQRAIQVKATRKTSSYTPVPPRRRRNDTPKFHPAARALAADAKRAANAAQKDPS